MKKLWVFGLVLGCFFLGEVSWGAGGEGGSWLRERFGSEPEQGTFEYTINPGLIPTGISRDTTRGKKIVAAKDPDNNVVKFVSNELIVDRSQLEAVLVQLAPYQPVVQGSDAVPPPQEGTDIQMDPSWMEATSYVIRLENLNAVDLSSLERNAKSLNLEGKFQFSSGIAAKLMASVIQLKSQNIGVSPNFTVTPRVILFNTREQLTESGGYLNALALPEFSSSSAHKSGVDKAWQFINALRRNEAIEGRRPSTVAIIDQGFLVDRHGIPLRDRAGCSDFPDTVPQYDFEDDEYPADHSLNLHCTGALASPACYWHGTYAASTATARLHNDCGSAGVAGQVAVPMFFQASTWSEVGRAIRTATAWGADITTMSFGDSPGFLAQIFEYSPVHSALREAWNHGVVAVAAAGYGGIIQPDTDVPCSDDFTALCVGALDGNNSNHHGSGTNYGPNVDIWAPQCITVAHPTNDAPRSVLDLFCGTSAATPYIAGVAALVKFVNPSLMAPDIRRIILETAWTDSPDSRVTRYVNAFAAVTRAAGNQLRRDFAEDAGGHGNNDIPERATPVPLSRPFDGTLTLHNSTDVDYFRFSLDRTMLVDLYFEFISSFGDLNVEFTNPRAGFPAPTLTRQTNRLRASVILPRGPHIFRVFGSGPNHYDMQTVFSSPPTSYGEEGEITPLTEELVTRPPIVLPPFLSPSTARFGTDGITTLSPGVVEAARDRVTPSSVDTPVTTPTSPTEPPASPPSPPNVCGDGRRIDPEECDLGTSNSDTGACTSTCHNARCGDGFVQAGEQCDDGNTNDNDACRNTCVAASCGDGVVRTGVEACDDGNGMNTDGCTNACALPTCGDTIVQAGEQCDDGNSNNTDSCLNTCVNSSCGDGFARSGQEPCDDGNLMNTDACTNACTLARCGDGFVQAGEQCDGVDVPTCNASCQTISANTERTPAIGSTTETTSGSPTGGGMIPGGATTVGGGATETTRSSTTTEGTNATDGSTRTSTETPSPAASYETGGGCGLIP